MHKLLAGLLLGLTSGVSMPSWAAHGYALWNDLKYPDGFTAFDYVNATAPKGGELRLVSNLRVSTFDKYNPFTIKGTAPAYLSALLFDTLLTGAMDETASGYGLLAQDVEVAPDRLSVTFRLRPEARFHNGSPVEAADVKHSYETLMGPYTSPGYKTLLDEVAGCDVVDAKTVRFRFKKPNRELPLAEGAIEPFTKPQFKDWKDELAKFAKREGISMSVPFAALPAEQQQVVIEGKGDYGGVKGLVAYLETKKYKLHIRVLISKYRGYTRCPDCDGGRLRAEARAVFIGDQTLPQVVALSIKDARAFFDGLTLTEEQTAIADRLLKEVRSRLRFLDDVGLDYLTLDRLAATLSGGEAQRIRLGVAPRRGVVEAVPVVAQAGFEEEVLAGEAEVLFHRAGGLQKLAEGIVAGRPDGGAGGVRQANRAAQVVGMRHQQLGIRRRQLTVQVRG